MSTTTWRGKRKIFLTALVAMLVCAITPITFGTAAASPLTWHFQYMDVTFDWNNVWDKTAYWAYGMAVFNIYDWGYLFGWYGLGWDKLSPLTKAPTEKLKCYLYNESSDAKRSWEENLTINFNVAHMDPLDISSNAWATQVLKFGETVSHECSHGIFEGYVGSARPDGVYSNWLTESLAYYTGNCVWPWGWGDYDLKIWGPLYTWPYVKKTYQDDVKAAGSGGLLTLAGAGQVYDEKRHNPDANLWNAVWTFNAVGYYLSVMDDKGVANNASFLSGLKAGKSISDAFYAVWQRTLKQDTTKHDDPKDFYFYFYNYMWL